MTTDGQAAGRRSLYIAQSNPVAGREDEYHEWYTRQHLPDMLQVPGFVGAQRFASSPIMRSPQTPPYPYSHLVIYEIAGDPRLALDALAHARDAGMVMSSAIAADRIGYLFEPITLRFGLD